MHVGSSNSARFKIVISEFMDETAVAALRHDFEVFHEPDLADSRAALVALLVDADALIVRNRTHVDVVLVAAAPQLRVVGRLGVGLDNIDVPACAARGIEVIPATGANAQAVAEYVIGTAMALLRGAYTRSSETAAGFWPRAHLSKGRELAGKTLGLIGFGATGRRTAYLAEALGMIVIAHDPTIAATASIWQECGVTRHELADVLAAADILSLHLPLTDATRGMIAATALNAMKQGAILINSARGGIVDESALAEALRSGHLGGAALDVFVDEPLPAGNVLALAPNVILTPHIAGVTLESNRRVSAMIAERVAAALKAVRAS